MPRIDGSRVNIPGNSWRNQSELQKISLPATGEVAIFFDLFLSPDLPTSAFDDRHVVVRGERLDILSNRYYGTPFLWWVIADANDIGLPESEVYPGLELTIPAPTTVKRRLLG